MRNFKILIMSSWTMIQQNLTAIEGVFLSPSVGLRDVSLRFQHNSHAVGCRPVNAQWLTEVIIVLKRLLFSRWSCPLPSVSILSPHISP